MKKMLLSLVVLALGSMAVTAASASAATTTCEATGTIKLSPGLSETAQSQNVTIKGTLSNCAGEESTIKSGKFNAHLKTSEAVTCAVLAGEGALVLTEPNNVGIVRVDDHAGAGGYVAVISAI